MVKKIALLGVFMVVVAACGDTGTALEEEVDGAVSEVVESVEATVEAEVADGTEAEEMADHGMINVGSSDLGDILTDEGGATIYSFLPDAQGAPTCEADCLANWPIVPAGAAAGEGLDASLLGSVSHPNGERQLTVNGWPVYYFAGDGTSGDTNGQNVNDAWFVLSTTGDQVSG